MALAFRVGLLLAGALTSACFDPGEGVEPPPDRVYFPVGLAIDAHGDTEARHLFVVNSDFDLQFNGGTVQSYDLGRLRDIVRQALDFRRDHDGECLPALGARTPATQVAVPGPCGFLDPQNPPDGLGPLIQSAVGIGALAVDALFRPRPSDFDAIEPPGRLYVPVRGDTTLHVIDVDDDGMLQCGQASNDGDCDDAHRRGDDPEHESTRGLRLPPEPFGIAASEDGHALAVTHQTEGAVSLFVEEDGTEWQKGPDLEFIAGNMPARPTGIVGVPEPKIVLEAGLDYQPAFLVSFRDASEVRLLRFFDDVASDPKRPYLEVTNRAEIRNLTTGFDSRGIAIDPFRRISAEEDCTDPTGRTECLQLAAATPLGVYVANRTPASLVVGETRVNFSQTSSDDVPEFFGEPLPLDFGPSRVVVGEVINRDGVREPRVFAVCFDSRVIYVYDPMRKRIETAIETGRGPHAFVVDVADDHAFGYVGSFTDSYIAVIGLDQTKIADYGKVLLIVGEPTPPRASK
jgi:hypothetical protein